MNRVISTICARWSTRRRCICIDLVESGLPMVSSEHGGAMGVYRSAIVGLGYDPKRASAAADLTEGQAVDLVRDYDNDHDDNAVAVFNGNRMLGFIPAR